MSDITIMSRLVVQANIVRNINEDKLWCLDCKLLPKVPITGSCGHTRCHECINERGTCPCGVPRAERLHVNILVRDLLDKMQTNQSRTRSGVINGIPVLNESDNDSYLRTSHMLQRLRNIAKSVRLPGEDLQAQNPMAISSEMSFRCLAAAPQLRFKYARELLSSGRVYEAATNLSHVAIRNDQVARKARDLLKQLFQLLTYSLNPMWIMRTLCEAIIQQASNIGINPASIECPICLGVIVNPVTTNCGHTFCRVCITRTMRSKLNCPLCCSSLVDFCVEQTYDTEFINAVMGTVPLQPRLGPKFMPIITCTIAFPSIACPVMIFAAHYRNVIRGLLDSGYRRFGIITPVVDDSGTSPNCGTVVEICNCVVLYDGRSILSTIGVSRFSVTEKVNINGFEYAHIEELVDLVPMTERAVLDLQLLAHKINSRVALWLPGLDAQLLSNIDRCYGPYPRMTMEGEWWTNPNGPNWLWWIISVLPLRKEVKMLMLSTKNLSKRMTAVLRMMDAIECYTYMCNIHKHTLVHTHPPTPPSPPSPPPFGHN